MLTKTFGMNDNRIMDQINAIFSVFMVIFYIGMGIGFIFFLQNLNIDKPLRVIMGGTFIFYGIYRAFRTYVKITEVFFPRKNDEE